MRLLGKQRKRGKSKLEGFVWSDDEVELLKVMNKYKVSKTIESVDWGSSQSKYSDILELFIELWPSQEDAAALGKDFWHKRRNCRKLFKHRSSKQWELNIVKLLTLAKGAGTVELSFCISTYAKRYGVALLNTIASGIETAEIDDEVHLSRENQGKSPVSVFSQSDKCKSTGSSSSGGKESTVNNRSDLLNAKLKRSWKEDVQWLTAFKYYSRGAGDKEAAARLDGGYGEGILHKPGQTNNKCSKTDWVNYWRIQHAEADRDAAIHCSTTPLCATPSQLPRNIQSTPCANKKWRTRFQWSTYFLYPVTFLKRWQLLEDAIAISWETRYSWHFAWRVVRVRVHFTPPSHLWMSGLD